MFWWHWLLKWAGGGAIRSALPGCIETADAAMSRITLTDTGPSITLTLAGVTITLADAGPSITLADTGPTITLSDEVCR